MRHSNSLSVVMALGFVASLSAVAAAQNLQPLEGRNGQAGQRLVQGYVSYVGRAGGNLVFRVRSAMRNNAPAANGAIARNGAQVFQVLPATRFEAVANGNRVPASFAALRTGQGVLVAAQGQQATAVRIYPAGRYARRSRSHGHRGARRYSAHGPYRRGPALANGQSAAPSVATTSRATGQQAANYSHHHAPTHTANHVHASHAPRHASTHVHTHHGGGHSSGHSGGGHGGGHAHVAHASGHGHRR